MDFTRDDLMSAVQSGTMSVEQARAEAKRLGLPPLEGPADLDALDDPARMPLWTLPMALAWIVFREMDRVQQFEPNYRAECGYWGWELVPTGVAMRRLRLPCASFDLVGKLAGEVHEDDQPLAMPYADALNALWIGLRSGAPEATGVASSSHQRVTIPDNFWSEAPLSGDWGDEVTFGAHGGHQTFREVRVSRRHLLGVWRPRFVTSEAWTLAPVIAPEGLGEMTLFRAALWIATEGGSVSFHPESPVRWKEAYDKLLDAIVGAAVKASGVRKGMREPIPGVVFSSIPVAYPYEETPLDLMMSSEFILQSYPHGTDEEWRDRGFHDSIGRRGETRWSKIMVDQPSVARLWKASGRLSSGLMPTGMPGRPSSSKALIDREFDARIERGDFRPSLRDEAKSLVEWIETKHPSATPPSWKTVETAIRKRFNRAKASK